MEPEAGLLEVNKVSYLKSIHLDELLETIDNEQITVLVHITDVSCVQPAILVDSLGCFFWSIEVSERACCK